MVDLTWWRRLIGGVLDRADFGRSDIVMAYSYYGRSDIVMAHSYMAADPNVLRRTV